MNPQKQILKAAAATAILGILSAGPAQAFTLTQGDLFTGDGTRVKFDFLESHGWFQSDFGVYDVTTDTYTTIFSEAYRSDSNALGPGASAAPSMGTCPTTVPDCESKFFTFEAGHEYSFFLSNGTDSPTVYSANSLNRTDYRWASFENQTKFFESLDVLNDETYKDRSLDVQLSSDLATSAGDRATLLAGMTGLIAFEDNGYRPDTGEWYHKDYNDVLVSVQVVPEPATILGLGLVGGAMALSRRRKENRAS